jgi:hypothetical protein
MDRAWLISVGHANVAALYRLSQFDAFLQLLSSWNGAKSAH